MDRSRLIDTLSTIAAIPVTPLSATGEVDWPAYQRVIRRLVDGGITVITPNGNTGEFYALTVEECDRAVAVTMEVVEASGGRALVMPGVGHDVATAVALGRTAARYGAEAVMVHQPVHPYQSAEGWVAYHAAIAEALPDLGVVPYVRDPQVTPAMLGHLARQPNVVGVKYAVPHPLQFAATVAAVGAERLAWICGLAEGWAPFFWPGGAVGFTSGLVNVETSSPFEMLEALRRGDYAGAMAVWRKVKPFEDLRARRNAANNVPVVKEALAQLGICGRAVRPPISEVPEAERAEVASLLSALGLGSPTPPVPSFARGGRE
ncbi:MAG TPA: dihydrodipicolinate synthase family protein [Chloroflexota bacterium]|nr:dihydrodipicolinate synthase family protein [Chloroflexota bacterium]